MGEARNALRKAIRDAAENDKLVTFHPKLYPAFVAATASMENLDVRIRLDRDCPTTHFYVLNDRVLGESE